MHRAASYFKSISDSLAANAEATCAMLSDDVFRNRLSEVITTLEAWGQAHRDCADVETAATAAYWKMSVTPKTPGACPFALLLLAGQTFNLSIGDEIYEDKPIDTLDFFPMLVRAIAAGRVARITLESALTGAVEAVETRVTLEDGWAWIGERRLAARSRRSADSAHVQREHRYLPYRR